MATVNKTSEIADMKLAMAEMAAMMENMMKLVATQQTVTRQIPEPASIPTPTFPQEAYMNQNIVTDGNTVPGVEKALKRLYKQTHGSTFAADGSLVKYNLSGTNNSGSSIGWASRYALRALVAGNMPGIYEIETDFDNPATFHEAVSARGAVISEIKGDYTGNGALYQEGIHIRGTKNPNQPQKDCGKVKIVNGVFAVSTDPTIKFEIPVVDQLVVDANGITTSARMPKDYSNCVRGWVSVDRVADKCFKYGEFFEAITVEEGMEFEKDAQGNLVTKTNFKTGELYFARRMSENGRHKLNVNRRHDFLDMIVAGWLFIITDMINKTSMQVMAGEKNNIGVQEQFFNKITENNISVLRLRESARSKGIAESIDLKHQIESPRKNANPVNPVIGSDQFVEKVFDVSMNKLEVTKAELATMMYMPRNGSKEVAGAFSPMSASTVDNIINWMLKGENHFIVVKSR